jgi:hypothetical protein
VVSGLLIICLSLMGCIDYFKPPPDPNCEDREAYYPDPDGDGWGDPTIVYIGCEAPDGWVTDLEPVETGTPPDESDSSPSIETGDSTPLETDDTTTPVESGDTSVPIDSLDSGSAGSSSDSYDSADPVESGETSDSSAPLDTDESAPPVDSGDTSEGR